MPKSRRGKGKYQAGKKKIVPGTLATSAAPASGSTDSRSPAAKPVRSASARAAAAAPVQYPYVGRDLKRIGVVAGVVVVILVVLALTLS